METKHTPGEWVTGSTDPLLFGRKQGNGTEPIGCVYGPAFPERSDVGQRALANARLIAAAPEQNAELVKVLRFLADLNGCEWIKGDDAGSVDMRQQAKALQSSVCAVVAKAEGR